MNYNFKTYPLFEKEAKRLAKKYRSLKTDLQKFITNLRENPELAVTLGKACIKYEWPFHRKAKAKVAVQGY